MYAWNCYGDVLFVIVVVGSTVVSVVARLNVHGTWFIVGFMFVFKFFCSLFSVHVGKQQACKAFFM